MIRLVIALLIITSFSCLREPKKEIFNNTQLVRLAKHISQNTPEFIHFEKGSKFDWVYFPAERCNGPQQLKDSVISIFSSKYGVFLNSDQIPDSNQVMENGELLGFKNGFQFFYRLEILSPLEIKISYNDHENAREGCDHSVIYEWTGSDWIYNKTCEFLIQ